MIESKDNNKGSDFSETELEEQEIMDAYSEAVMGAADRVSPLSCKGNNGGPIKKQDSGWRFRSHIH
jgi:hypothetical protein